MRAGPDPAWPTPVATAASNAKNVTVSAPTSAAFEKIPKADLDELLAD